MVINESKLIETICDNFDTEIIEFLKELDNWMADASFTEKLILELAENISGNLNIAEKNILRKKFEEELNTNKDF